MAIAPYNVDSMIPCENGPRKIDGAYRCYLHHLMGSSVKRTAFNMGNFNPLDVNLTALVIELQARLPEQIKHLRATTPLPIDRFVGLSIVRHCVRNGHGARLAPAIPDAPRTERVANFVFAKESAEIFDIKAGTTITSAAIGSAVHMYGRREGETLEQVVHLPVSPQEKQVYPATQAVATFPNVGRLRDPYVALHNINLDPEANPEYIEQIVTRSDIDAE